MLLQSADQPTGGKTGLGQYKRPALDLAVVMSAMAVVLAAMGRRWWCQCGSFNPFSWDIWSSHNSQHAIDPYFATHVLHGIIFYAVLTLLRAKFTSTTRFTIAIIVEAFWEIIENTPMVINRYREATISLDYFGDSIVNSCFDLLACVIGYVIASKVSWPVGFGIFWAVEVVLLLTIHDSLLLNVIMLIAPQDAILQWQSVNAP